MEKTQRKNFWLALFFFGIFAISFFYLPLGKVYAALEVQYPTIADQALTAESKLPDFARYLFLAGLFVGFFSVFLSLVVAGAMYLLSPAKPDLLASAKDRIGGAISGLLILALAYLIISTINPQLSILTLINPPPPVTPPVTQIKESGVYFNKTNCPGEGGQPNKSSIKDLGALKNAVHSVSMAQEGANAYISILYDAPNFQGMCQYVNPNTACTNVTSFAASASIHTYDFYPKSSNPADAGVYFYRKSYFNAQGGSYEISNEDIIAAEGAGFELNTRRFNGVPIEEQDCTNYNDQGICTNRTAPSLGGENISSVKIRGNYLVVFIYYGKNDTKFGPWTFCQEFPVSTDLDGSGPREIKWQPIRNGLGGTLPNYVIIIPIKK